MLRRASRPTASDATAPLIVPAHHDEAPKFRRATWPALGDILVIAISWIKRLTGPFMFGTSEAAERVAVTYVERPILSLAWTLAGLLLPFGWTGTWAGVQSRDDALASREPGRSIAVRVHTLPNGASSETIVLWMHGGGMFMGSAAGEDALARFFCARLSTMVVSVAYRKAPEFAHPAALHDVLDAATALLAAHPHARLLLAGMSAGGYYAIQAALALGSKVVGHVAIAPMVGPFAHFLSVPRNDPISLFPARAIQYAWSSVLRERPMPHTWDATVSALLASDDQLRCTSPGIVTYHTFDILRDEGEMYAGRLASVGRLLYAAELPYPHGSGFGMGTILETVASQVEAHMLHQPQAVDVTPAQADM